MTAWRCLMLSPDARSVLSDALRPPPGSVLSRAVALTFTLDLESALVVPLAFAAAAVRESSDPLAVMEGVRRCADRVDVFCQAGNVRVPARYSDLLAFVEGMVHPVRPPRPGRLFHPKLWALRFWDEAEQVHTARLLVLSRNLTADRSWDVCLRLDGVLGTRPQASNRRLVDLIRRAVGLSVTAPGEQRLAGIEELVQDLRRVVWQPPAGVREVVFHALGVPGAPPPDFDGSRYLVVSPFCTQAGLEVTAVGERVTIVSRQEELDRLPVEVLDGRDVLVVSELAGLPADEADPGHSVLTGLHAKLYIVEKGHTARVLVGSANATDAAFGGNVELLVELIGGRTQFGVDSMVGAAAPFRAMLEPYDRQAPVAPDEDERRLEDFVRQLAAVPLTATVTGGPDRHVVRLDSQTPLPVAEQVRVTAELVTRRGEAARLDAGQPVHATFAGITVVEVTPFILITAQDRRGASVSTVVLARLIGDPAGRLDELLARQVDTPEKFLRFLALLLGLTGQPFGGLAGAPGEGDQHPWVVAGGPGILELLLRALVDRPDQLDDLGRLVERMRSTDRGRGLLPEGFLQLWQTVDAARREPAGKGAP